MKLLLDTHVVLWLAQEPERVPASLRAALDEADERVISAVSAYEISFKARLGRLPHGRALVAGWELFRVSIIATERPVSAAEMARAGDLDWDHRDPFDRILVAQAQVGGLALVTADAQIRAYPDVRTIWS